MGESFQLKKLVCFVEGEGDQHAVPILARRVLKEIGGTDVLAVDQEPPFMAKGIGKLLTTERTKQQCNWLNHLQAAGLTRQPLGGVLLVLDGDEKKSLAFWKAYAARFKKTSFCARDAARLLAQDARAVRAGDAFSVGVVFAVKEFEAWLLAGIESLRGVLLSDGRTAISATATRPGWDDFEGPRDPAGELSRIVPAYDKVGDQHLLAAKVSLDAVAEKCPSFRRFRSAIGQIVTAVRTGRHVATPTFPVTAP